MACLSAYVHLRGYHEGIPYGRDVRAHELLARLYNRHKLSVCNRVHDASEEEVGGVNLLRLRY